MRRTAASGAPRPHGGGPGTPVSFVDELRDFLRFVRRPTLARRLPRRPMAALAADWVGCIRPMQLLRWAILLWTINLLVFGPVAVGVAGLTGADHRADFSRIPWVHALLWAPVLEELMFRFGLRRPGAALWVAPAIVAAVMMGLGPWAGLLLAVVLALTTWRRLPWVRWKRPALRRWRRAFPYVFHLASLAFALLHLMNFQGAVTSLVLLPLLVLPQWITGLVLGWLRVRAGIGAAIALHSLFNAGPILLLAAFTQ